MIKLFEDFLNKPKFQFEPIENITVYRVGKEKGEMFNGKVTFYTSSKKGALTYGKYLKNPQLITKKISFQNPLILEKNYGQLYEILDEIFGKFSPSYYEFPYSLNDTHREKIIDYAIENGYDGIMMSDTDYNLDNIITSFIEIN